MNYLNETRIFTPEQVAAAFLVKLKDITENALGTKVNECVISVRWNNFPNFVPLIREY